MRVDFPPMAPRPARTLRFYRNETVKIESGWSSLDGKFGKVVEDSNGGPYVRVAVPGYQHSMLWSVSEVKV